MKANSPKQRCPALYDYLLKIVVIVGTNRGSNFRNTHDTSHIHNTDAAQPIDDSKALSINLVNQESKFINIPSNDDEQQQEVF